MNHIDSFKKFVPAEILASFTAINAVLDIPQPNDIFVILAVIVILTVLFVVEALMSGRIESRLLIAVTAVTLPLWCTLIAIDRFETGWGEELPRSLITVTLIIASLALTLLDRRQSKNDANAT